MQPTNKTEIESVYTIWFDAVNEVMKQEGEVSAAFIDKTRTAVLALTELGIAFDKWPGHDSPAKLSARIDRARADTNGDNAKLETELLTDGHVTTALMYVGTILQSKAKGMQLREEIRKFDERFEPGEFEGIVIGRRIDRGIVAQFG